MVNYLLLVSKQAILQNRVVDDFNPIHDEDNKRFCVPGDLLFSVLLANVGLSQKCVSNLQA